MKMSKNDRTVSLMLSSLLLLLSLSLLFSSLYSSDTKFKNNGFLKGHQILPKVNAYFNISWLTYTDNNLNISFIYPKSWELINSPNNINNNNSLNQNKNNNNNSGNGVESFTWILKSPKENVNDSFQENIVINLLKFKNGFLDKNNLDQKQIIEKLEKKNANFIFNNSSSMKIGDNHTAESITYSFNNSGLSFKTKQIFSITKNNILIVSVLGEQKSFDLYLPIFDRIVKNISVKNG